MDFIANQLLRNKTLNPGFETTTLEGQNIRLKPKKKVKNNDRMRLTPLKVIDHTLTTKTPRVTSQPQTDLTSNTIRIDNKLTDNHNHDTHHRIIKRQAMLGLISVAIGFGGGVALTRYLDNKQLTKIEEKLQNLRDADDAIIHHLQHNDDNIKINRDSISNTARILVGITQTIRNNEGKTLHRSDLNQAFLNIQQSIHTIRQNMNKYRHIIECALQHRLSIEALSYQGANQAFSKIKTNAKGKGLKTVITTA